MPAFESFCRVPLVDPAFVALPDHAVHTEGTLEALIRRALDTVDLASLTQLDAVLATKLGDYSELPPMPNLAAAAAYLPKKSRLFMDAVRAAMLIAVTNRDKSAMLDVLAAMRNFSDRLPAVGEYDLLPVGADALRVASELYRRTGQRFLLTLMERLRVQLPDVSGMFHSFPFLKPFVPEPVADDAADEASQYFRRMKMLGTGSLTADALSICAQLALFSGSARDASASKAGVSALQRYHGMPHGAFSADPFLAGRDPARSADLPAVCAQLEALHDLLAASGDVAYAERMQRITENALAGLFHPDGLCAGQAVNRFAQDDTCLDEKAEPAQSTALLRALYAVRRSVWMLKGDDELAMLLPYDGCCLTRLDGTPVRLAAKTSGNVTVTISIEAKQPAEFALCLHVPGYAQGATVAVNQERPQPAECGKLHVIRRLYKTGDTVTLTLNCRPFLENGYRGSVSVHCGAMLMALPLPDENAAWQYALDGDAALSLEWDGGRPRARVEACAVERWHARNGVILPPPQGCDMGEAYELTLLPYADTLGRIAAFPLASHRI